MAAKKKIAKKKSVKKVVKKAVKKTTIKATKKAAKKSVKKVVKKAVKKAASKSGSTVMFGPDPISTSGKLPKKGAAAPAFSLTTGTLQEISNRDLRGKRVILNIFPSIDTPTCATSARTFNELASSLNNTEVYCVSADLPFAQSRYCGALGLTNVKTASSFRSNFGKTFGVNLTEGIFKGILARAVVVLDEKGKVLHSELVGNIGNEPNYEAAINSLK